MKITEVTALAFHPGWRKNLVFVKVETDAGITGWGEAYSQYDRDPGVVAHLQEFARYVPGRDPFQIKYLTTMLFDDYAQRRGSLEFYSALSGLEAALWDIVGKATGQPVYNLLGGRVRDRIRVYANGWSYKMQSPADYAEAARRVVDQGFTALKFDPLPRPWRTYIPRAHERHALAVTEAIRDAVGPDVDLLIELHRRLAPMHAISLGQKLEAFEPYWLEEPCQVEHIEAIAEVRAAVNIPIVTGENAFTKAAFRPILEARAADILNPDVSNCGGILELKEIAALAEPFMVAMSPHNYNSTTLSLAATVHAAAVMPNFVITEYFVPFVEVGDRICANQPRPVDGYIPLSEEPGLGLTMDEAALRAAPARPFPARSLPRPGDEVM
jgi:galactonate dehydratase